VLLSLGPARREVLRADFRSAGLPYPPPELALVAFKAERRLEVWGRGATGFARVRTYAVLAASGGPGPKLREGDLQVPEGIYRLTVLNPASSYHLSIRVDYPNAFDRRKARADGRTRLGGDIYVHGRAVSIGCLALGDAAIEELFVLAADTGLTRTRIVIAPAMELTPPPGAPPWTPELYALVAAELRRIRG
jgi:murein L,D-transpeptidase YafK